MTGRYPFSDLLVTLRSGRQVRVSGAFFPATPCTLESPGDAAEISVVTCRDAVTGVRIEWAFINDEDSYERIFEAFERAYEELISE